MKFLKVFLKLINKIASQIKFINEIKKSHFLKLLKLE